MGQGGIPLGVQSAFGKARAGIESDYATAQRGNQAYLQQAFAQGQNIYNTNQLADTQFQAAKALDVERQNALRSLQFQEAEAGLGQFNTLMNMLGSGAGAALNLGAGFSGAQAQAIGGMSGQSPGWGAVGGAASGAATGSYFGPYGALIGGVLGGVGGYLGSGG